MQINLYKSDLIGLSSESKPTNQINGTTYYEVDTMKFYIYYKGEWYLQAESDDTDNEDTQDDTRNNDMR